MLTLEHAAKLLQTARSIETLSPILTGLGFVDPVRLLDTETRARLALPATVEHAGIAAGAGSLRGLAL